jgi:hypothetical protein
MTHLPTIPDPATNLNDTPLPLLVAKRWNFPLATQENTHGLVYAIQDWMRGLSGESDTRYVLSKFKKTEAGQQMWNSIQRLPYTAADGKTYKRDYRQSRLNHRAASKRNG